MELKVGDKVRWIGGVGCGRDDGERGTVTDVEDPGKTTFDIGVCGNSNPATASSISVRTCAIWVS